MTMYTAPLTSEQADALLDGTKMSAHGMFLVADLAGIGELSVAIEGQGLEVVFDAATRSHELRMSEETRRMILEAAL